MTAAMLVGIVATSAVGSIHCVAMCGPLVGLHGGARTLRLAGLHSLGRLTTYVVLGTLAGLVGSALDLAGRLGSVQRAATLVAGASIVAWGLWQLGGPWVVARLRRRAGVTPSPGKGAEARVSATGGAGTLSPFARGLVRIRRRRPGVRAWLMGTLTGLVPCGWLWAFVVAAGGTGHAATGAAVMAAFWLGTVPAMVGLLAFAAPVLARARARMPAITAVVMIAVGLGTLAMRWRDAGDVQVTSSHCAMCHGAAS